MIDRCMQSEVKNTSPSAPPSCSSLSFVQLQNTNDLKVTWSVGVALLLLVYCTGYQVDTATADTATALAVRTGIARHHDRQHVKRVTFQGLVISFAIN